MNTTNVNILSDEEWRLIHNALSIYQTQQNPSWSGYSRIQPLMDKVRDNYITNDSAQEEPEPEDGPEQRYSLRDAGRNPNGDGESYAEQNR